MTSLSGLESGANDCQGWKISPFRKIVKVFIAEHAFLLFILALTNYLGKTERKVNCDEFDRIS